MRTFTRIACILLAAAAVSAPSLRAHAISTGSIKGRVTEEGSGKSLPGVTVSVTSPALQGEQSEFTDGNGDFTITELPPGEYMVRFYYSENIIVERPNVILKADQTLAVNVAITTSEAKAQTYRITERAPTVDVGNTQIQTQVGKDLIENTPVRGRTFESVLTMAPGSTTDPVGFSFNGATGPENNFLLDGLNTTNVSHGLVGSTVPLDFLEETNIITGGYAAEYGRATGGVVSLVTKSGSNEFKGEVWINYRPGQADPGLITRLGEGIAVAPYTVGKEVDFGFTLGGPIVKDRLWFFAGFAPDLEFDRYDRIIRSRVATPSMIPAGATSYDGDKDTGVACPDYLKAQNPALCAPSAAGALKTKDTGDKQSYNSAARLFSYIGKLDLRIDDDNKVALTYMGNPSQFNGYRENGLNPNSLITSFNANPSTYGFSENLTTHDLTLKYNAKLLDKKLQIEIMGGYHYEKDEVIPNRINDPLVVDNRPGRSLGDYEGYAACQKQMIGGVEFNPCPVQGYASGGFGTALYNTLTDTRWVASAGVTYFLEAGGTHALKVGGDYEQNGFIDFRAYTGGGFLTINPSGSRVDKQAFSTVNPDGSAVYLPNGFTAHTRTDNESLYLRDAYSLGFLPGATINLGVRWEGQQVRGAPGADQFGSKTDASGMPYPSDYNPTAIEINDNFAPRVGLIYDWTQKGLSKIFASYGRFFESIPLDINDRQFSGEGLTTGWRSPVANCQTDASGGPIAPSCMFPALVRNQVNGGVYTKVQPNIQGQYSDEFVGGVNYDIGFDTVLGIEYIHRELGRVIEDISPDRGANYIIANPGEPTNQSTVTSLQNEINALNDKIGKETDMTQKAADTKTKDDKVSQLGLYKAVAAFAPPRRFYNALVLTAQKRLAKNVQLLASYTYSRTIGNYPGLYSDSNGQLDPNISTQYDLRDLLANRDGPLPNDRPHNFKLNGSYTIQTGDKENEGIVIGAAFSAISGKPIEVLGYHPWYADNETFILPRGAGGRTPTLTSLDLHVGYDFELTTGYTLKLSADVFNVLNQKGTREVDETYTSDEVLPIINGTYDDLKNLRTTQGTKPVLNPNYGQPTQFQAPLSMRFGARLAF